MRREKHKIKIKPRRARKRWQINPRTRVHAESGYKRVKMKKELRKVIKEEDG